MKWPDAFYEIRRGVGCPMCQQGRPEETDQGVRFYKGKVADAYLTRHDVQPGLTVVIWRGHHVAEPTELADDEAEQYWHELLTVGRAIEQVFRPIKLNYNLLGNSLPHLHTHIVPRYSDDPRPGWPFPFPEAETPARQADVLRREVDALRAAIGNGDPPSPGRLTRPQGSDVPQAAQRSAGSETAPTAAVREIIGA